jgi:gliding motility-associated-like protein
LENPGEITFPGPGSYNVNLTVQANGCLSNYIGFVTIPEDVESGIAPQTEFCDGFDLSIVNASVNAQYYQWIVGNENEEMYSTANSPNFTFPNEGIYPITLIAYNDLACPDTSYSFVEIYPYMTPYFEVPVDVYCFDEQDIILEAEGSFQDFATFLWDFGNSTNQNGSTLPITDTINFIEPGVFPVTLTIFENGCEKNYTQNIEVHPNPLANFTILDSSGCKPLSVQFINLSEAWTPLNYSWNFENGYFSLEENPSTEYSFSGFFTPSLTVSTSSGCVDEDTFVIETPIHVFPLPQANFTVEPNVVDILDPEVYITDISQGATSVYYEISNGDSITIESTNYTFYNAGLFEITQTVWNEFGCISQVTGGVRVNGYLFFMPTAFTPNGDGYNDVLRPEHTGILNYLIQVYDRWGKVIFTSNDPNEGWEGNDISDGVYNYIVKLDDLTKTPHHYSGSITLIR